MTRVGNPPAPLRMRTFGPSKTIFKAYKAGFVIFALRNGAQPGILGHFVKILKHYVLVAVKP